MRKMNKRNFQKELDILIENLGDTKPELLLHSCCAPCSSYVLEYLNKYFNITVLYYNPNIYPEEEYFHRKEEQKRFISEKKWENPIKFMDCDFESEIFYNSVKGLESEKEGGKRCEVCFNLRLDKTAELAKKNGFEYFCTTLSISPLKNAEVLNKIGEELSEKHGIKYLPSDFKKKNGYKRSIELSKEFSLYRQDYCGCVYSRENSQIAR